MSRPRQWSDADTIQVRDALALLHADPGSVCPVCDQVGLAEQRWLFWLGQEGYQDQGVLRQLRASLGLCARHTRRLLAMGLPWVATGVLAGVVDAALHRLRGDANDDGFGRAGCPACQELARSQGFTLTTLLDGLADARVDAAYQEHDGLCLPHTLAAVATADGAAARLLVATLRRRLRQGQPVAALATLAGRPISDAHPPGTTGPEPGSRDAGRPGAARRSQRDGSFDPAHRAGAPTSTLTSTPTSTPTVRQLQDDVATGACPACLRAARMQRRYVGWLAADADRARDSVAREGVKVCAAHLHDLAAVDNRAAGAIAAALAQRVDAELAGFEAALAALPPTTIGGRLLAAAQRRANRPAKPATAGEPPPATTAMATWTDALRPSQHALEEARHGLLRWRDCRVCQERDATAARTLRLLGAALADPATARAYEASPGLCARHALAMLDADHPTDAGRLVRQVANARLGVLAWELDEAARKRAWSQRHEPPGPEADAWWRGAALVDGMAWRAGPPAEPGGG